MEDVKQNIKETRKSIPVKSGKTERFDTEYERNGTSNIFIAFETLKRKRKIKVTDQRKKTDWSYFIKELVSDYPMADKIVLVMDNLNTHRFFSL